MTEREDAATSRREQLRALGRVAKFRPMMTAGIVVAGVFAASLEAVGLSFILPIVEIVQAPGDPASQADGVMGLFVATYQTLGVPFTLGTAVVGVSLVLTVRWTSTFVVRWLRSVLEYEYIRELQTRAFENALDARIEYFDQEGSDDILNAIVTQAEYAGRVIRFVVNFLEQALLSLMYLAIAFVLAPELTVFTLVFLGGFTLIFRYVLESGYDIGDRVADANEGLQQAAQAGTQGIRDTKIFGLKRELFTDFVEAVKQYSTASIKQSRNQQAIQSFYNLLTAITVFLLIYLAITYADMSLGALGVFLFAMFRLGPKVSTLNSKLYQIENNLPHLVRTQDFTDELDSRVEGGDAVANVPSEVTRLEFSDVSFSYNDEEQVLRSISFDVERGEFVAFVGPSGAGKSTIVSLLARMYETDAGTISANGKPIDRFEIDEWRSRIAVVRQNPFIFNDTLRYNVTIGNRDATDQEIERVCEIAQVTEFLDDLPKGYETKLGDDGVRLSGGQRQRISIARALLKDSDILVLDEATSDLDSTLEEKVHGAIERMDRDQAMLVIAHRLSTVMNADRIYTMVDGEISEMGTHDALVENNGKYAELYATQTQS